jgi:hypothetical protein
MKLNCSISEQLNGYLAELPILERSTPENTISRVGLGPPLPTPSSFSILMIFFKREQFPSDLPSEEEKKETFRSQKEKRNSRTCLIVFYENLFFKLTYAESHLC